MAKEPFTEQHRAVLEKALEKCREARMHMESGAKCGMDCSHDAEICDYLEAALNGYKSEYFSTNKQIPIS